MAHVVPQSAMVKSAVLTVVAAVAALVMATKSVLEPVNVCVSINAEMIAVPLMRFAQQIEKQMTKNVLNAGMEPVRKIMKIAQTVPLIVLAAIRNTVLASIPN